MEVILVAKQNCYANCQPSNRGGRTD